MSHSLSQTFTHFIDEDIPGQISILSVSHCEKCRGLVQEPNAMTAFLTPTQAMRRGLVKLDRYPAEIWPDDECGGYCCDNCLED